MSKQQTPQPSPSRQMNQMKDQVTQLYKASLQLQTQMTRAFQHWQTQVNHVMSLFTDLDQSPPTANDAEIITEKPEDIITDKEEDKEAVQPEEQAKEEAEGIVVMYPLGLPDEIWDLIHQACFAKPNPFLIPLRRVCVRWSQKIVLPNMCIRTILLARLSEKQLAQRFQHTKSLIITDILPLKRIEQAIRECGPNLTHISLGRAVRGPQRDENDFENDMQALDKCFALPPGTQHDEPNPQKKKAWSLALYQYQLTRLVNITRLAQLIELHNLVEVTIPIRTTQSETLYFIQPLFSCTSWMNSLRRLDLVGLQIRLRENDAFLLVLAQCISNNTTLTSLALRCEVNNHVQNDILRDETDQTLVALREAFFKNTTLLDLHLDGAPSILVDACASSTSLKSICIDWFGKKLPAEVNILLRSLKQCPALESFEVHLSRETNGHDSTFDDLLTMNVLLKTISSSMGPTSKLERVVVCYKGVAFNGTMVDTWSDLIENILLTHPRLRYLELPFTRLSAMANDKISAALEKSPIPRKLVLHSGAMVVDMVPHSWENVPKVEPYSLYDQELLAALDNDNVDWLN